MITTNINKIDKVEGENIFIFQGINAKGNATQERKSIEEFLLEHPLIQEKEKRIIDLKEAYNSEKEIKGFLNERVNMLSKEKHDLEIDLKQSKKQIEFFLNTLEGKDLDDNNLNYKKALEYFISGDINNAIDSLEEAELIRRERSVKQLQKQNAEVRWLKGILYAAKSDVNNAIKNFESAVSSNATWNYAYNTADYLNFLKKFSKAESYYKIALEKAQSEEEKGRCYQALGLLYSDMGRLSESMVNNYKAYQIWNDLIEIKPNKYLNSVIEVLNNFSISARADNDLYTAQDLLERGITIANHLENSNNSGDLSLLAALFNNYASVKRRLGLLEDAIKFQLKSLEIRKRIKGDNSITYQDQLANTFTNLGNICFNLEEYDDSVNYYEKALDIKRKIVEIFPDAYLPSLASLLSSFGGALQKQKKSPQAKKVCLESLNILRVIEEQRPTTNSKRLIISLVNLGVMYQEEDQKESFKLIDEAVDIILKQNASGENLYYLENALSNMEIIGIDAFKYIKTKDYSKYNELFKK